MRVSNVKKDRASRLWLIAAVASAMAYTAIASGDEPEPNDAALAYVKALEEGRVEQVRSGFVSLGYTIAASSPAVQGAELFVTTDEGRTWREVSLVNSLANPISYDAVEDGLYGFSFVLHSASGSMERPKPGMEPQRWVMVDRAAPKIAIRDFHAPESPADGGAVSIGWLVTDENNNLGQRPVTISYRADEASAMAVPIARGLDVEGTFRWNVPINVGGPIVLRVSAEDRAGNRDFLETRAFTMPRTSAPADTIVRANQTVSLASAKNATQENTTAPAKPDAADQKSQPTTVVRAFDLIEGAGFEENSISAEAAEAAKKQYDLGTWHRLRGEHDEAVRRYRAALDANPLYHQARNDLAGTLLVLDRLDEALREYERILEHDRRYAPALEGLALTQIRLRRYRSAHTTLERLLRERPNDPEVWLHYGDVCMFMGDRRAAREAWRTAETSERAAASVKSRAGRRLAIHQRDRLGATE